MGEGSLALDTPVGALCLPPPPAGLRQNPPGQVQAPEKHHQLHCQVGHEEWVVALPHAVLHPGAVVVVAAHTATALTAVPGPQGLLWAWREVGSMTAPLWAQE